MNLRGQTAPLGGGGRPGAGDSPAPCKAPKHGSAARAGRAVAAPPRGLGLSRRVCGSGALGTVRRPPGRAEPCVGSGRSYHTQSLLGDLQRPGFWQGKGALELDGSWILGKNSPGVPGAESPSEGLCSSLGLTPPCPPCGGVGCWAVTWLSPAPGRPARRQPGGLRGRMHRPEPRGTRGTRGCETPLPACLAPARSACFGAPQTVQTPGRRVIPGLLGRVPAGGRGPLPAAAAHHAVGPRQSCADVPAAGRGKGRLESVSQETQKWDKPSPHIKQKISLCGS